MNGWFDLKRDRRFRFFIPSQLQKVAVLILKTVLTPKRLDNGLRTF
jgi:hypothetical protein